MTADGSVEVRGAAQFGKLARDLRVAGRKDLQRELYRGLSRAAKPLIEEAKSNARRLPGRGGLADRVRAARFSVKRRGGRNPSIRIIGKDKTGRSVDLAGLDRGIVRHPVYGNRRAWVTQRVAPDWWSDAATKTLPRVQEETQRAIDDVVRKLEAGG